MPIIAVAACAVLSYLLGSIPFTYLAGRLVRGIDLSRLGSGNLGGANAVRVLGPVPGLLAGLSDVGKAALAVVLARLLAGGTTAPALAATAAALGHSYSLYLGFAKGGKAISPLLGSFAVLAPLPTLASLALGLALVGLTRFVSLGALAFAAFLPVLLLVLGGPVPFILAAAAMACLAFWRHRGNIGRLLAGTERRLGERA